MDIFNVFLPMIFLFFIIYFAVRLAIKPLMNKEEILPYNEDLSLTYLRDIEILSDTELQEVIKIYKTKSAKAKNYKNYAKYAKVIDDLKESGYINEESYLIKISKLKEYFKVD